MRIMQIRQRWQSDSGISLIEVVIVIVVVGIVVSLALQSMTALLKDAKTIETEREMDMLARAIAGDPSIMAVAGGERSEFGYVGDVGALPPNLAALVTNPGYSTWNGPYVPESFNQTAGDYNKDAWGEDYDYTGGIDITSTGSGTDIEKKFAESSSDVLSNDVFGLIRDVNDSIPSVDDTADVNIAIVYPDGAGGIDTVTCHPSDSGWFEFSGIPIGRHRLHTIYTPEVDTLTRQVTVVPRRGDDEVAVFNFGSAYFSSEDTSSPATGLTFVSGSDTATAVGGSCCDIRFWIENSTADPIQVDSMKLEYSTTAYYVKLDFEGDGTYEFDNSSSRNGSGEWVAFGTPETIPTNDTTVIKVETFKDSQSGPGSTVDMENTTFTVTFSDGSTFEVAMSGYCE